VKRQWLEITLAVAGIIFLSKAGWGIYKYWNFQRQGLIRPPAVKSPTSFRSSEQAVHERTVIGQLTVPRLGMSTVIVEGDDENSLSVAAGHMQGTALIGSKGNAVVAGHRDTVFWPLRNIQRGDHILVSTGRKYIYSVEQTQIVDPADTRVLQNADRATLTLVTCYPFHHVGPSPKRFVVIAKLRRTGD
jgi:sortase A